MAVHPIMRTLIEVVKTKLLGVYPSHVHYKVDVPPGVTIEAVMTVPTGYVYIVPGEIHDVPVDVFTHKCIKDGYLILPETLIDGTSMVINYPEPMVVEREWRGAVTNVSDTTQTFRLRVPILVVPTDVWRVWVEMETVEAILDAVRSLLMDIKAIASDCLAELKAIHVLLQKK